MTTIRAFTNNLLRIAFLSRESLFTDLASDLSSFIAVIVGKVFMSGTIMRAYGSFRWINLAFMSEDRFKRFVMLSFISGFCLIKRDWKMFRFNNR